ncbi:tyrosine-type recombinase/integrase [Peribacillus sp. NPDC097295]|uniref:tyrosine-type recombinase/integrase n=1 Tax=Peribacillus sp. NPDC097295 TaxID=3364402 RepID=UPI00382F2AE0
MHKHIREFAKSAFEGQLITSNFTTDVTVTGKKSMAIKQYLTTDEYERFTRFMYNAKIDLKLKLMILIPLLTGTRYGELCAICWDDIDFEKNLVHIHRQWDYVKGDGFTSLKDPLRYKNEGDIKKRYLPLSDQLVELLKTYKSSPEYTSNKEGRLFYKHGTNAQALSNSAYNDNLDLLLSKLNILRITCHKLRHSYATNLVKLKISREAIQYLMGHESYETTEKYYVHLNESLFKNEFLKLNSIYY